MKLCVSWTFFRPMSHSAKGLDFKSDDKKAIELMAQQVLDKTSPERLKLLPLAGTVIEHIEFLLNRRCEY